MGMMRILDSTGDSTLTWTIDDDVSVHKAADEFAALTAQHRIAFARRPEQKADEAEIIRKFDPSAEEIIWVRPIQGG